MTTPPPQLSKREIDVIGMLVHGLATRRLPIALAARAVPCRRTSQTQWEHRYPLTQGPRRVRVKRRLVPLDVDSNYDCASRHFGQLTRTASDVISAAPIECDRATKIVARPPGKTRRGPEFRVRMPAFGCRGLLG
jgi:hypothetical protein